MPRFPTTEIHAAQNAIDAIARRLYTLARAFEMTGNDQMASELRAHAEEIRINLDQIGESVGAWLGDEVKAQQAQIGMVLGAVLNRPVN